MQLPYWLFSDREKEVLCQMLKAFGLLALLAVSLYLVYHYLHARGRLTIALIDPGIPVYLLMSASLAGVPVMNACAQVVARYPQRRALPLLLAILALSTGSLIALQILLASLLPVLVAILLQYLLFGAIALWALSRWIGRALKQRGP